MIAKAFKETLPLMTTHKKNGSQEKHNPSLVAFCIIKVDIFIKLFLLSTSIALSANLALTNTLCRVKIHFTHVEKVLSFSVLI